MSRLLCFTYIKNIHMGITETGTGPMPSTLPKQQSQSTEGNWKQPVNITHCTGPHCFLYPPNDSWKKGNFTFYAGSPATPVSIHGWYQILLVNEKNQRISRRENSRWESAVQWTVSTACTNNLCTVKHTRTRTHDYLVSFGSKFFQSGQLHCLDTTGH